MILHVVDTRWREHLESMDYLREGVHLRAMAQKDPLVEYRHEGHLMFRSSGARSARRSSPLIFHAQVQPAGRTALQDTDGWEDSDGAARSPTSTNRWQAPTRSPRPVPERRRLLRRRRWLREQSAAARRASRRSSAIASEWDKVGRNDPCPCGSGKKYKKCHGA